mmetsp:Transcript_38196/g.42797  ORF Transcript_38196/g.42797 Transcript_38196/m.42797 type:complete len:123 (+) Transcript_38196:123-491(+)
MKLPIVSLTTFFIDALSRNTSVVEAGCPMAHQTDDPTRNNPHARATAAANDHSMKVHHTPLIDFKLPPKNRHASCTHTEGGVLVETPPPQQQQAHTIISIGDSVSLISRKNTGRHRIITRLK